MTRQQKGKKRWRCMLIALILLATLASKSSSFIVQMPQQTATRVATVERSTLALVGKSTDFFDDDDDGDHDGNVLTRAAKKVASWFRHKQPEVEVVDDADDSADLILSRPSEKLRSELMETKELFRPFPWPIRAMGTSLERTVNRELTKEERNAKPLLKQALHLIKKDKVLYEQVLGKPVHLEPIFSRSSSTSVIDGKKTRRITDSFEVVGSRKSGVATLVADKYAKGHIKALRVDVGGIHYDVDV